MKHTTSIWSVCAVLCVLGLLSACGESVDTPDAGTNNPDVLAEVGETNDRNTCGGSVALSATPGEACGECLDGFLACDGIDALRCLGATLTRNACGTCEPLLGSPGDPCGCDGVLACEGPRLLCNDQAQRNACGGCLPLDGVVGAACNGDGGNADGILVCGGPNTALCRTGARNECGATGPLVAREPLNAEARPGDSCGTCGRGVVVCSEAGESTIECADAELGTNACGGCEVLSAAPGDACGCGGSGQWVCDNSAPSALRCDGAIANNACGGCDTLPATLGARCEDAGVWACGGPDSLSCVDDGERACGLTGFGATDPGASCGLCDDGVAVCASAQSLVCTGTSERNACGGCGQLPGEPGAFCAGGRVWECGDDNTLRCNETRSRNACGGVGPLVGIPGDACGACGDGLLVCISDEDVACLGGERPNACGGCSQLPGVPGRPCGECNTGRWACDGPEGVLCAGEDPNARFLSYADLDGDGFGDPDSTAEVCPAEPGYVRTRGDCDDTQASVYPGAPELCDGLDNNCDGDIDEDFIRWPDADNDGFGDPEGARILCTEVAGYVDNARDCYDGNAAARPGQTVPVFSHRGDGSFDYNCDGVETKRFPENGRCGTPPLTCAFVPNGFRPGWVEGPITPCGEIGELIFQCLPVEGGCEPRTDPEPQWCL
jgi:hypothetical protein